MDSSEQSVASARASVMVYDDLSQQWLPSGSSSGLSKVHIYQHIVQNTFRIVGRKLQDHEVVLNCAILKGLQYNQATPMFHQWRDNRHVHGLNCSSKDDACIFALPMLKALEAVDKNKEHKWRMVSIDKYFKESLTLCNFSNTRTESSTNEA
ncbi:protein enabled homolog isoform X2 [Tachypleus tridentatus]|uniref:protein enabled homolog isoform X2 n=1 Tax=Tachypleus tridentatus TaxID=6853 RepID=UPI003FCF3FEC